VLLRDKIDTILIRFVSKLIEQWLPWETSGNFQ
jgi:hypothetical protein